MLLVLVAVVPTLNEVGSLARLGEQLLQLDMPGVDVHLLIVDDDSTDGTARVADEMARQASGRVEVLHRVRKHGLGSAYLDGFTRALANGADLVAQMDADLSHEPAALRVMVDAIRDGDLVMASRYMPGGGVDAQYAQWGWHRKLLSWLANAVVVPALVSLPVSDATSGYRLWRRDTLAQIVTSATVRSSGYGFQVEMAYLAHRLGAGIKEVPIYFRERATGQSKMNAREAVIALCEIIAIPRQHRRNG